ncbi:hypothetical protein DSUL_50234 [Desulfovibrionales bacterium]
MLPVPGLLYINNENINLNYATKRIQPTITYLNNITAAEIITFRQNIIISSTCHTI